MISTRFAGSNDGVLTQMKHSWNFKLHRALTKGFEHQHLSLEQDLCTKFLLIVNAICSGILQISNCRLGTPINPLALTEPLSGKSRLKHYA